MPSALSSFCASIFMNLHGHHDLSRLIRQASKAKAATMPSHKGLGVEESQHPPNEV